MRKTSPRGGHHTIMADPEPVSDMAPRDAALLAFGQRLQSLMDKKGWNQSETARALSNHRGSLVQRDTVSKYVRGQSFPSSPNLAAIAAVFGVERNWLMPTRGMSSNASALNTVGAQESGNGKAWLRVNQEVDWATAIKVLELLKKKEDE